MKPRTEKSMELYQIMLKRGYPEAFCDQVTKNLNTDWTAQRMIGYLSHYKKLPMEEIADEMLAILSDRNRLIQKKHLESVNASWNEYLMYGFGEDESRKPIVPVAAALIWNEDKFLICQRPANKARGLLWEFVGGKVEAGETKEQALVRECKEELNITIDVSSVFMEVVHEYPDITVQLTLFHAAIVEGEPQLLEHNDMRWITASEIPQYEFCPADKEILEKIMRTSNSEECTLTI